ncbi:MAG: T9SS type A sorting domain-containing protein [Flavobacteriales bacterium]|nr:T9SS type A sorting domain-containing protein [Flavobacteriales bacterium]
MLTGASDNEGIFNYGIAEDYILYDVHVYNGGQLYLNSNLPFHFGEYVDLEPVYHHKMATGDCASYILVNNGGKIELAAPLEERTETLTIRKSSTLELGNIGELIVNSNSKIIIESDAELKLTGGLLELSNGAKIIVKEGGKLMYDGTIIKLNGPDAAIIFEGGELHVAPGKTFTFSHEGDQGGYVEFSEYGQHVFTGTNSVIKFQGNGPGDLVLKITDGATLWNANYAMGRLEIRDGKVNMSNLGHIYTDMKFTADNVAFEDLNPSSNGYVADVQVWFGNKCMVTNCQFTNVRFVTQSTKSWVTNSTFNGPSSGMKATGGYYGINNCDFLNANLTSSNLTYKSRVSHSFFNPPAGRYGIKDESLAELTVYKTNFIDSNVGGIYKEGGQLTLKCDDFQTLTAGVTVSGATLNMSALNRGGYNSFSQVNRCIRLLHASGINLKDGYNDLSGYTDKCITGTLDIPCLEGDDCLALVNAQHNFWGYGMPWELQYPNGAIGPEYADIEVYTSEEPDECGADGMLDEGCPVKFTDGAPQLPTACGVDVSHVVNGKKNALTDGVSLGNAGLSFFKDDTEDPDNPHVTTTLFDDLPLDHVLWQILNYMEDADSLGNDLLAIDQLYQVFNNDLNQQNPEVERKMIQARLNMQNAINNLYLQGEMPLLNSGQSFQPALQQYVDVMNDMTVQQHSDSTWQHQFYLELEKVQMLRSAGLPNNARHLIAHVDDCGLHPYHQLMLNKWMKMIEQEVSIRQQYVQQAIPIDSINYAVDSSWYEVPGSTAPNEFYFGSWIYDSDDFDFMSCGMPFEFKSSEAKSDGGIAVYPNPGKGDFYLLYNGKSEVGHIEVRNALGELIGEKESPLEPFSVNALELVPSVPGIYYVVVSTATGRWSERVVVVN